MDDNIENFIELRRTFFELPREYTQKAESDDLELSEAFGLRTGKDLGWDELLKLHRVILLAEAGTGKTEEIRQTAKKLRSEGKPAFFLRLEHVSAGLEGAFEEGDFEEFRAWADSYEEGWLFLDSVDEARLKNPLDFEQAIRKIANELRPALQRVHITITGRSDKWRAKTDLALCNKQLAYDASREAEDDFADDIPLPDDDWKFDKEAQQSEGKGENDGEFKVYSISDLSSGQVEAFARGRDVSDVPNFLSEIERQEAWAFTTRPQDLLDVIEFWNTNGRIGTRSELIENSVQRRLMERKENTAAANPISLEQVRKGAKLIAAASTLMKEAAIRVPDGSENRIGIDAQSILSNWTNEECKTLLGRPIFDAAIYGAVRFHHRRVREYLTAEWIHDALENGASRKAVNSLFFKRQYGVDVLIPSMRPVLSWLVLLDEKIRKKACSIEPEVVFEGGDPSRLPVNTRREILRSVCAKIADDTSRHSVTDYSAVQRFANPDMADEIKSLVSAHKANSEITSFLVRMIWQGRITQALPEAKSFALDSETERYTRMAAIRAIKEIGSDADFQDVLNSLLAQESPIDRRLLADTVDHLNPSQESVDWIFRALEKTSDRGKYSTDGLSHSLVKFAGRLDCDAAFAFVRQVESFLEREPVIERRYCEVSRRFGWLMNCGAKAVEKLVTSRHPDSLSPESLSVLAKIPPFKDYAEFEHRTLDTDIANLAKDWTDFRFALFWKDVEVTRKRFHSEKDKRLTNFWQAHTLRQFWSFDEGDFERVLGEIEERTVLDDRLVALSLAFQLYKENGRPRKWRERLKRLVKGENELEERLASLLRPPPQSEDERRWKQQEARWKQQSKKRKEKRRKHHAEWQEWLSANFQRLCDKDLLRRTFGNDQFLNAQYYLLERMRKQRSDSTHWTQGNWRDLTEEFGEEVATAFRDGLMFSWRLYTPALRAEKDRENSTSVSVILGLSGLEIEASETDGWPDKLSKEEVELACRYAFEELNGFPSWFPKLHKSFPKPVIECLLREIDWELASAENGQEKHYIVDKVSWSGHTLWDDLAPELLKRLESEPRSLKYLGSLLKIVQSSQSVSDDSIARLAAKKCETESDTDHVAKGFAAWIGVEPAKAIEALSAYLKRLPKNSDAVQVAMSVVVSLTGEERTGSQAREGFKSPEYLKRLYLLMHEYIKVEEDIERAGKGVYSPELRDHAQDARNRLFQILKEIPGRSAYLALNELAKIHPAESYRAWMSRHARERAEIDADRAALTGEEFLEFKAMLEGSEKDWTRFLHLKPSVFGMGVNLNEVWLSLKRRFGW